MLLLEPAAYSCIPPRCPAAAWAREAHAFVDWLADAGQSWWQVLPLGPPDRHRSPYKSRSAFAAWPGLLADPRAPVSKAEELDFRERSAYWIEDWERLSARGAVADQVRFDREWGALRGHAAGARRADHGRRPDLRGAGQRRTTARIPSSSRTARWPACRPTRSPRRGSSGATRCTTGRRCGDARYRWWTERLRRTFELFDLARIDHFRGFVAYWAVPAARRRRCRAAGSAAPGARCSTPPSASSARRCRSWPRTSA